MKRIVIQVHVECDKCRSKALKIAAVCQGVRSVSLEGESGDQVVVTGEGVDSVCLTNQMRKKFRSATLISVEDVNANEGGDEGEDAGGEQENETTSTENLSVVYCYGNYLPASPTNCRHIVYYPDPNSCCVL